jgi:hypothetical protein
MGNRAIVSIQKNNVRSSYYLHWNGGLDTLAPVSKVLFDFNSSAEHFEKLMTYLEIKVELQDAPLPFHDVEENGHYLIDLDTKTLTQFTEKSRVIHSDLCASFEKYLSKHISKDWQDKTRVSYWQGIQKKGIEFFKGQKNGIE